MQADPKVKLARDGFPLVNECTYLDTASVGPVSRIYATTLAERTDEDLHLGRARLQRFERADQAKARIRNEIAELLAVDADRLELTQGTISGVKALIDRFPWHAGDEILTTQLEFPRCTEPLRALAQQRDIALRVADVPLTGAGDMAWLADSITPRTRLIFVSGVAFATGQRLPVEQIAEFASSRGISTLVDGAQLAGAADLNLAQSPVDFVAMPLQKWIGGPEGLGALYVRDNGLDLLREDSAVHGWPVLEATGEHLVWLRKTLGWPWIFERTRELCRYAIDAVASLGSDRLITPQDFAGIVSTRVSDDLGQQIFDRLGLANVVVRHRPEFGLIRVSTAFFTDRSDIDRFIEFVR